MVAEGYNGFHMPFSKFTGEIFDCNCNVQLSTAIQLFNSDSLSQLTTRNWYFQRSTAIAAFNRNSVFQRSTQPRFNFSTLKCDCNFQPRLDFSTLNCSSNFFSFFIQISMHDRKSGIWVAKNSGTSTSSKATFKCGLHFQRPTVPVTAIYYESLLKIINGFY